MPARSRRRRSLRGIQRSPENRKYFFLGLQVHPFSNPRFARSTVRLPPGSAFAGVGEDAPEGAAIAAEASLDGPAVAAGSAFAGTVADDAGAGDVAAEAADVPPRLAT